MKAACRSAPRSIRSFRSRRARALQNGLVTYDERRGFHGPVKQIATAQDWGTELAKVPALSDVPEWQLAVVLAVSDNNVDIGLQPDVDGGGKVAD